MITLENAKQKNIQSYIDDCEGALAVLEDITLRYDIFGADDLDKIYKLRSGLENRITLYTAALAKGAA